MEFLIRGCNFLSRNVPNEVFTIDYQTLEYEFKSIDNTNLFPYLLVNIGSGVSILKVSLLIADNHINLFMAIYGDFLL